MVEASYVVMSGHEFPIAVYESYQAADRDLEQLSVDRDIPIEELSIYTVERR